jgi:integrase
MARKPRHTALETRNARLKLPPRFKPYSGPTLARGIKLLYRRNQSSGSWIVKSANGKGGYWTQVIAVADDFETSDGSKVLTFYEAQDKAKALARKQSPGGAGDDSRPVTLDEALVAYARDITRRGGGAYNAERPRFRLTPTLLAKPVTLLSIKELRAWRDSLLDLGLKPSSVARVCTSLCAALNLAASLDSRIENRAAWQDGLKAPVGSTMGARNVILKDDQVRAFIAAAYAHSPQLGLLIHVLAETGTRPSQAGRLTVDDLQGGDKPRLMMPRSGKGGTQDRMQRRAERISVPITEELFAQLQAAAAGRPGDAPLLLRSRFKVSAPWSARPTVEIRGEVRDIVRSLGLDPDEVTPYALRHSSIVRQLLLNVPIRVVAATHDTSAKIIEKNYSKFITDHSDDLTRGALLRHGVSTTSDKVVPIKRRP